MLKREAEELIKVFRANRERVVAEGRYPGVYLLRELLVGFDVR